MRTLVSKKLRTLMNLVTLEAPAARVSLTGEALELLDATLRVVSASHGLQVVADHLVEALAQSFRLLAGSGDQLLVDGEGDVHGHSIRGHILCVNLRCSLNRRGSKSFRSRSWPGDSIQAWELPHSSQSQA